MGGANKMDSRVKIILLILTLDKIGEGKYFLETYDDVKEDKGKGDDFQFFPPNRFPGELSVTQCFGKRDGFPCAKRCWAPDCSYGNAKCLHGYCKRGNVWLQLSGI